MSDHLETVDGEERPRDWSTFRHQLVERARVSGEDPLFLDSQRYIQAALLALRGTGSAPHTESFISLEVRDVLPVAENAVYGFIGAPATFNRTAMREMILASGVPEDKFDDIYDVLL